jgi:hypothetical protein
MKILVATTAMAVVMAVAAPASAALLLTNFNAEYYVPTPSTPYASGSFTPSNFTVGAGVETIGEIENVTFLTTDFGASSLRIDFATTLSNPTLGSAAFNGPIFDTASSLGIIGVSINPLTNLAGFTADRVLITDNRIGLNFQGLSYENGSRVAVDFTFAPIPEPATWSMMIAGFLAAGAMIRNRRGVMLT